LVFAALAVSWDKPRAINRAAVPITITLPIELPSLDGVVSSASLGCGPTGYVRSNMRTRKVVRLADK
jgi:hypothetical protein